MKRIFTLIASCLIAIGMQAQDVWTVAGSSAICGSEWKTDDDSNNMVKNANGVWEFKKEGCVLENNVDNKFKVVKNHSWDEAYPGSDYVLKVNETATYTVTITFDEGTKTVNATTEKTGSAVVAEKTWTIAGNNTALFADAWSPTTESNNMEKQDDGTYKKEYKGVELAAGKVEFKVCANHAWSEAYPGSNYELIIDEAGTYDVTITFDEGTKAVNATAAAPAPVATGAVFDIQNNNGNWGVGEGTEYAKGNFSTLTMDGVVLTNIQGSSMNPARIMKNDSRGIFLQCFKNIALKFNAPEGKAITKVEVTMQSGSFDMTPSTGAVEENVWTGNATEVTFENTKGVRYVWKFVVTIADENAETVKPVSAVEVENIAAFNALEDGVDAKLTLTNARVNGYWDLRGAYYVEDATGAFAIKGLTLTPGTVLNGTISGKKASDKTIDMDENVMEICINATDASTFTATETTLEGTAMAIDAIGTQANYGKLITVENVEITGSGQNKTLTDADGKTIKARDFFAVLPADFAWPAKASKLTGVLVFNVTGWFLAPVSAEAIVADTADGIIDLKAEAADKAIYNLQGIRLQQLKKGPNIVDGKVVIVK